MKPIRVLVVDDSALMRQMISRILTDAGMEVVATARDGIDGLEKVAKLRPDVVTLDVEMPRMDGLTMLRHLMAQMPLPVVMLSSLTSEQAPTAIEALSIGAVDVVGKPGGTISLNLGDIADEIVTKVRAAATARVSPGRAPRTPGSGERTLRSGGGGPKNRPVSPRGTATIDHVETSPSRSDPSGARPVEPDAWAASGQEESPLVVVGSSTGGPKALTQLLTGLPESFPAPIVVVQHMPVGFTQALAVPPQRCVGVHVAEAQVGRIPRSGEVWVARGGVHLTFSPSKMMREDMSPPHLGVRPAVDITLESAVEQWGGSADRRDSHRNGDGRRKGMPQS